jgi:hypothetical protein
VALDKSEGVVKRHPKKKENRSVGVTGVGTDDADAMVDERRVHAREVYARHVAGDAIL